MQAKVPLHSYLSLISPHEKHSSVGIISFQSGSDVAALYDSSHSIAHSFAPPPSVSFARDPTHFSFSRDPHVTMSAPNIASSVTTSARPILLNRFRKAGAPAQCIVWEGVYGFGYEVVSRLCAMGTVRILILSRFILSDRAAERFRKLER